MKFDRLFQILYLLQSEGRLTAGELSRRLEVSERTIRRDIESLVGAGVPVQTERGAHGGISLMPGAHLTSAVLTPEEREQVILGVKAMTQLRSGSPAHSALTKLSGVFPEGALTSSDVSLAPWEEPIAAPWLEELRGAVRACRCVRMDYVAREGRVVTRVVEPVRLVNENRAWYLVGWCRLRSSLRSFRLTRIQKVEVLDETFVPDERHERQPGECAGKAVSEPFEMLVAPRSAWRVVDAFEPEEFSRLEGGFVAVATTILHYEWVLGLLMLLGSDAYVVKPEGLRSLLVQRAREVCEVYEPDVPDVGGDRAAAVVETL